MLEKKGFNRFFSDIERALRLWDSNVQTPRIAVRASPPQLPSTNPPLAIGEGTHREQKTALAQFFIYLLPTEADSKTPPPIPFPLRPGTALVGRSEENDIQIQNPLVSNRHARIDICDSFHLQVEDIGSSNGTFLNGLPVSRSHFSDGDLLRFANAEYLVQIREINT
jgi:hypothetical protein